MAMYTSDDIGVFLAIANFHSLHLEKDLAHCDCDVFESICEAIMVRNKTSLLANWEQFLENCKSKLPIYEKIANQLLLITLLFFALELTKHANKARNPTRFWFNRIIIINSLKTVGICEKEFENKLDCNVMQGKVESLQ